jgi:hypothetical protein
MEPLKVFIGWDPRDDLAAKVCKKSIEKHASIPVEVTFIKDRELRKAGVYWRPYRVDERGQMWDDRYPNSLSPLSTEFSLTRFAVPLMVNFDADYAVFVDADFMFRADIAEMIKPCTDEKTAVWCVKHDHDPKESTKMDGVMQTRYHRKNWSSLMVFRPYLCRLLNRYALNNWTGLDLHAMKWVASEQIGSLPLEWNVLDGWTDPAIEAKAIHYTRGTPDMLQENLPYADEWWAYSRECR